MGVVDERDGRVVWRDAMRCGDDNCEKREDVRVRNAAMVVCCFESTVLSPSFFFFLLFV